jgi:hypothetical protein
MWVCGGTNAGVACRDSGPGRDLTDDFGSCAVQGCLFGLFAGRENGASVVWTVDDPSPAVPDQSEIAGPFVAAPPVPSQSYLACEASVVRYQIITHV